MTGPLLLPQLHTLMLTLLFLPKLQPLRSEGTATFCFFSILMACCVAFCSCTHSCWYRCCNRSKKGVDGLWGEGHTELEAWVRPGHLLIEQDTSLSMDHRLHLQQSTRSPRESDPYTMLYKHTWSLHGVSFEGTKILSLNCCWIGSIGSSEHFQLYLS